MPALKTTYTLLSGIILCAVVGLVVMAAKYNSAFTNSRDILKTVIFALLVVIFSLLCGSLFLILYNFRRRRLAEKGLLESEQRFSLLVQHVNDYAIFMIDPNGRVMTWNRGAEQIKGYKASEVIGQPISLFYTEEEINRQEPADNLKKAAELGSFESIGLRRRKDGSVFYADVVFTCMRNEKGGIAGYIKITRDISEQMKTQEEMKQALRREKDLNEMKSRFVTLASHEFKTPLSVILSSTSLIEKYSAPEMEDKRMRHVQRIKSNVKNLRQILNDFLSLEKLEEGVVRNNPTPTDLVQLAEEAILDMEESCKAGQRIVLEVKGAPRMIDVDDHLLRNILNNLISNAVKYSPESTPILCSLQFQPETVDFIVIDSGIGIPAEEQNHLFERFFRATNASGISGTGLGLSIVKRYLDLMDGRIEVSSEPDKGTIFTITLPAVTRVGGAVTGQKESPLHL